MKNRIHSILFIFVFFFLVQCMSNQKENVETPFMRYMLKYNDNIIGSLTDEKFKYFIVDKYYDSLYYIYNNTISNLCNNYKFLFK